MRRLRWALALLLVALPLSLHERSAAAPPPPSAILPPLSEAGLPPLPAVSPRNANYTIQARLLPDQHTIEGTLELHWRNLSRVTVQSFPFHLYWNAFRNNLSASARGKGRRAARTVGRDRERSYGYLQVVSVHLVGRGETDLTPSLRYRPALDVDAPGAGHTNTDDRTVMEVFTPFAIAPGGEARFRIAWTARIPYGDVGRAGWVHDYHFIAQWFPKIAVISPAGTWSAYAFYPWTEFFSDYGVYDVRLTLPRGFVVGATGELKDRKDNGDGTETFNFVQEDVHDFAWTASRRFREHTARFDDPGYPPVQIRLLVQPEHDHLAQRYLEATRIALRSYGAWSAPYPYRQVTVVDPAWTSASGGMEYPTLFTGGASIWAPPALQSPESVTVHEAGHQFWYGLVGNNEFEEAWLDEGFNSYHDEKAQRLFLGPNGWGRRYFGLGPPARPRGGWPVVAPGVRIGRGRGDLPSLRRNGESDSMARAGYWYRNSDSYSLNSYGKPALSLQTLEGLVGAETMTRIMRTYARRWRYRHPTSLDFMAVVNEVTGQDWRWFFDQTWFSSDLCDYTVTVENEPPPPPEGYIEGPDGRLVLSQPQRERADDAAAKAYDVVVEVRRLGEVRMPVEVLVEFADGSTRMESWDGQYRWTRFRYRGGPKVRRAVVDPARKLAIDVDPANNSWVDEQGTSRRAARKWAARWMFWLQNFLEIQMALL